MKHLLTTFCFALFLYPAFAENSDLFSPVLDQKKLDEHYRKNVFEKYPKGRGIVHFVKKEADDGPVSCLSISLDSSQEEWTYWITAYEVNADGEITKSKRLQVDDDFPYDLRALWSKALWLSSAEPHPPSLLGGPNYLFFGGNLGAEIGTIQSPAPDSLPAKMVDFASDLAAEVSKDTFSIGFWKSRCESLVKNIPKISTPMYSEASDDNALNLTLDKMRALDLLHRVRYIILEGFSSKDCPVFRKELIDELAHLAPKQWKELMESSGNMHNPKVLPIRCFINDATIKTPTVVKLNEYLANYQLYIVGLDTEKLSFNTSAGGMPSGMLNFIVKPIPTAKKKLYGKF